MPTTRVIIAGSRDFTDYNLLCAECGRILKNTPYPPEIISGMSRGADKLGWRYAKEHGLALKEMPAQWGKYGKSAGYRRNTEMADYAGPDGWVIAFWNGISPGTKHMIQDAKRRGMKVYIVNI